MFKVCGFSGKANYALLKKMISISKSHLSHGELFFVDKNINIAIGPINEEKLVTDRHYSYNGNGKNKKIHVVLDGEIYNYPELIMDLEKRGYIFLTKSNSEIVGYLYEEYGDDFVVKIDGSFIVTIWDGNNKKLLLARDRMGMKSMYYFLQEKKIIFGSGINMIFKHPLCKKKIDFESLHHFFSFGSVPQPRSIFKGISYLLPGELLIFKNGIVKKNKFWQLKFQERQDIDERDAIRKIRKLLARSIILRKRNHDQFGVLLSGGTDSSSIVAIMSTLSKKPIKTFNLNYGKNFKGKVSDSAAARKISKLYKTEHHEYLMEEKEIMQNIKKSIEVFDEPLGFFAPFSFFSKIAEDGTKVLFSGDGGDELFGGYPYHLFIEPNRLTKEIWKWRFNFSDFNEKQKKEVYSNFLKKKTKNFNSMDIWKGYFRQTTAKDSLGQTFEVDIKNIFPDQTLPFSSKMTEFFSVQTEMPFLDYRLVEFIASLKSELKVKDGVGKYILKSTIKNLLHKKIANQPKEGFALLASQCLSGDMEKYVKKILAQKRLDKHGFFNSNMIDKLIKCYYDPLDNGYYCGFHNKPHMANGIINLVMFQLWWEKHFG